MLNRLLDNALVCFATAMVLVGIGAAAIVRDLGPQKATDYCAIANFRTCQVTERGEWILLRTPDGQHMVYLQNGKVVQIQ